VTLESWPLAVEIPPKEFRSRLQVGPLYLRGGGWRQIWLVPVFRPRGLAGFLRVSCVFPRAYALGFNLSPLCGGGAEAFIGDSLGIHSVTLGDGSSKTSRAGRPRHTNLSLG
jgi:hypothetical protein